MTLYRSKVLDVSDAMIPGGKPASLNLRQRRGERLTVDLIGLKPESSVILMLGAIEGNAPVVIPGVGNRVSIWSAAVSSVPEETLCSLNVFLIDEPTSDLDVDALHDHGHPNAIVIAEGDYVLSSAVQPTRHPFELSWRKGATGVRAITRSEYNTLPSHDDATLYLIIDGTGPEYVPYGDVWIFEIYRGEQRMFPQYPTRRSFAAAARNYSFGQRTFVMGIAS